MPLISYHILLNRHCNEKHILFAFLRSSQNLGFKGPFEGSSELWAPPLDSQFHPLSIRILKGMDGTGSLTCQLFDHVC